MIKFVISRKEFCCGFGRLCLSKNLIRLCYLQWNRYVAVVAAAAAVSSAMTALSVKNRRHLMQNDLAENLKLVANEQEKTNWGCQPS